MPDPQNQELEEGLARLEVAIRQLKVQYDMFFAGSLSRQPLELRSEIEKQIKRYSRTPIRKYAPRFHFNALVSRFNSYSELWAKTIRSLEEGNRKPPALQDAAGSEAIVASCLVADPAREHDRLRDLHARFVEARVSGGGNDGAPSFEAFVRGVATQTNRLREKAGCEKVELRVIVSDGKVQLKARPGR